MIVNLTQHKASEEQMKEGVFDLPEDLREELIILLSFEEIPSLKETKERAKKIAEMTTDCKTPMGLAIGEAMIGGALWLMEPLSKCLRKKSIEPLFAFSKRESVEQVLKDGSVRKTAVFKHIGFVSADM